LSVGEFQIVESGADVFGECPDSVAESVVLGECVAFFCERMLFGVEFLASTVEFFGSALKLDEVDHPGLIEIDEAVVFALGGFGSPAETGELSGEELIVGSRGPGGDCVLAGEEDLWAQQGVADLFEDVSVQGVGTDVAFPAAAVLTAGSERVVIAAVVVTMFGAIAAAHLVAADADTTSAAANQRPQ
jgi:hypothetical protein